MAALGLRSALPLTVLVLIATMAAGKTQEVLGGSMFAGSQGWTVMIAQKWDVLGPFPIHAREQHFLSPSFPLNLTEPIDLSARWPSSYADGGSVGWTKTQAEEDGSLQVSFPDIRWASLRATEGWAALQHHTVLRSTLTVYPPPTSAQRKQDAHDLRLLVDLIQGSFFTIIPSQPNVDGKHRDVPEWHAGNIYALGRSPPNAITLPTVPSLNIPTTYEIFISGDYEIRLFGDPRHSGSEVPKLSINISVEIEEETPVPVVHDSSHDVVCDFVAGWAFGNALGIGLLSHSGWWTVVNVQSAAYLSETIGVFLLQKTTIAPSQRRIVPIRLTQKGPMQHDALKFLLTIQSDQSELSIIYVNVPIKHHAQWSASQSPSTGIKASYFFGTSMPTAFLASPPENPNADVHAPPLLALHGAGVDIFANDFWMKALPRQKFSWVIAPTGRTEWGLDWHGPSAQDAWSTVVALYEILDKRDVWRDWGFAPNAKVLLLGHSNGGQGAWYVAARSPDKVVGVVPAAAYIKSQSYVPWIQSRSAHYVDPALRAVLDSSLTPDDNDLFLTNLVNTPILAIHGGDDDNVPVWHTREAVSIVKTWNDAANITFREDPGQPHWYDTVFTNDEVASFISSTLENHSSGLVPVIKTFTLTVAVPADSGTMQGWRIRGILIPGRLARLAVEIRQDTIHVQTVNVRAFTVHINSLPEDVRNVPFVVDGEPFELDQDTWNLPDFSFSFIREATSWMLSSPSAVVTLPPTGRSANILSTKAPVIIVIPTRSPSRELSAALRVAHNLNVYHKLDTEIIDSEEASLRLRDGSWGEGNIIVIGCGDLDGFAATVLRRQETPFGLRDSVLQLRGRPLKEPSTATLFLHPHPTHPTSLVLFVYGVDEGGLERGLRLFPIRTGVTVPDWIVIGSDADERGSGGVEGAGVWGNDWSWNEPMSAF